MAFDLHTVSAPIGTDAPSLLDRRVIGTLKQAANGAGGGAGAAVTTAITGLNLPANYLVIVTPNQDAVPYVPTDSTKTQNGFHVVLNPRLAANTLAAGTFDVLIVA